MEVYGYDIDFEAVSKACKCGIIAKTNFAKISSCDVYHICLSTYSPNFNSLFKVSKKISKSKNNSSLISIESTVNVGVCQKLYETIFDGNALLIYVPHRFWEKDPILHGVRQVRVFGYVDNPSFSKGMEYYCGVLKIPLIPIKPIEAAELCKITENAVRFVDIAFAENLKIICDKFGLDFELVRFACNSKWNIDILEARNGVYGHCLIKDTKMLHEIYPSSIILTASLLTDEIYKTLYRKKEK